MQVRIASIQHRFDPSIVDQELRTDRSASSAGASTAVQSSDLGAFDRVLDQAIGRSAATQAPGTQRTPATQRTPGAYGPLDPPAELRGYGNGRIPEHALSEIGVGSHRLSTDAANAFRQMRADANRAGIDIGVTDSYRSFDQQVDVARRKGLYSQGGLAAAPGTSNHGWGLSLDLDLDADAQAWLRSNGASYGFVEDTPREPWHWTYRPDRPGAGVGTGIV